MIKRGGGVKGVRGGGVSVRLPGKMENKQADDIVSD